MIIYKDILIKFVDLLYHLLLDFFW